MFLIVIFQITKAIISKKNVFTSVASRDLPTWLAIENDPFKLDLQYLKKMGMFNSYVPEGTSIEC